MTTQHQKEAKLSVTSWKCNAGNSDKHSPIFKKFGSIRHLLWGFVAP